MKKRALIGFAIAAALTAIGAAHAQEEPRDALNYRLDDTPLPREQAAAVTSYAGILREVRPAVVSVFSRRVVEEQGLLDHPALRRFFGEQMPGEPARERVQRGVGSGLIISPNGYILTNNHVIAAADRVAVLLEDGRELDAEVVGTDPQTDVAVLRVEADDLPTAVLGDSDQVEVGDLVFALGNALGIGPSVTTGIISARGRSDIGILGEEGFEDFIQTDAAMNIGNSGGPLVDARGRVIGVNTAIASPGGGNIGIGFAVPINLARGVVESLIEHGEVQRGFVGIQMQRMNEELAEEFGAPDHRGALIVDVLPGSPAEDAGLQSGDVIREVNGQRAESPTQVRLEVGQMAPGATVELGLIRDGQPTSVEVELGRREQVSEVASTPGQSHDSLLPGLAVQELTPQHRQELDLPPDVKGLIVTDADPASPYADVLPPGSVILQINRQPVADLEAAAEALQEGRNLLLVQQRDLLAYVVIEVVG